MSANADDFLGHIRAIDQQYTKKFGPWLAIKRAELEALAGRDAPEVDQELEEHCRVYIVDKFLEALNWRTGLDSSESLPTLAVEQPVRSEATGRSVRLDYLGVEAATELPLMVVETKASRDQLPKLLTGSVATYGQVFARALAGSEVTGGWRAWLRMVV